MPAYKGGHMGKPAAPLTPAGPEFGIAGSAFIRIEDIRLKNPERKAERPVRLGKGQAPGPFIAGSSTNGIKGNAGRAECLLEIIGTVGIDGIATGTDMGTENHPEIGRFCVPFVGSELDCTADNPGALPARMKDPETAADRIKKIDRHTVSDRNAGKKIPAAGQDAVALGKVDEGGRRCRDPYDARMTLAH